ncbi:MAG: sugar transferase [Thermoleophilaceae bacterium]|nr:sugar transferase [Thermoleophilaceae bacterium]
MAIGLYSRPERPERASAAIIRDSRRRRSLAIGDLIALLLAYGATEWLSPGDLFTGSGRLLALAVPVWLLLNKLAGLYDRDANLIHKSTLDEIPRLLNTSIITGFVLYVIAPNVSSGALPRSGLLGLIVGLALIAPLMRVLARGLTARRSDLERCLIVGSGPLADLLARKIVSDHGHGLVLVGVGDVDGPAIELLTEVRFFRIADPHDFARICRDEEVERVIIASSGLSVDGTIGLVEESRQLGLKVNVAPPLFEVIGHSVAIDQLGGTALLGLPSVRRTRSSLALKRSMDIIGAAGGLAVLSPFLLIVGLFVKLSSPGPVLFRSPRIGSHGGFQMLKFRTMIDGAEALKETLDHLNEATGPMFKIAEDPRITRWGRLLRRTSVDELPQLWNVLSGEMSLVGPRPLVPEEDGYIIGRHRARLDLTPGLTGPWQVLGRTSVPFEEMVMLDYLYVTEWSLWNDMKLLLRTLPVVLYRRGL